MKLVRFFCVLALLSAAGLPLAAGGKKEQNTPASARDTLVFSLVQEPATYKHVTAMQDLAFSIIRPGIPCSLVDKEVTRYYEENGLMKYWRHHTGHALGLGKHEAPFFDSFDDTLIEPGMVFSVEPGLYVKTWEASAFPIRCWSPVTALSGSLIIPVKSNGI